MSQSHLRALYEALTRRGWKVVERRRGEADVRGAATWEISRRSSGPVLRIDFAGFGGLGEDIQLEASGDCQVRGLPIHLYFFRVRRSRERWLTDLAAFVAALDQEDHVEPNVAPDRSGSG